MLQINTLMLQGTTGLSLSQRLKRRGGAGSAPLPSPNWTRATRTHWAAEDPPEVLLPHARADLAVEGTRPAARALRALQPCRPFDNVTIMLFCHMTPHDRHQHCPP